MTEPQEFENKVLHCVDFPTEGCMGEFIFTSGEQKYFASKNLVPPKRCPPCRQRNKARIAQLEAEGKYKHGRSK